MFHTLMESIDKSMNIEEIINKRYDNIKFDCLLENRKIKVSCKKMQTRMAYIYKKCLCVSPRMLQLSQGAAL